MLNIVHENCKKIAYIFLICPRNGRQKGIYTCDKKSIPKYFGIFHTLSCVKNPFQLCSKHLFSMKGIASFLSTHFEPSVLKSFEVKALKSTQEVLIFPAQKFAQDTRMLQRLLGVRRDHRKSHLKKYQDLGKEWNKD